MSKTTMNKTATMLREEVRATAAFWLQDNPEMSAEEMAKMLISSFPTMSREEAKNYSEEFLLLAGSRK